MIKLMIVDDEVNIRRGLREYISWDAWEIELAAEAENAESALNIAMHVRPDILLTDIRMDRMDGIEMTRRLKEMLPELKVILLSGYSDIPYLQAALQLKAVEYLLKPAGADKIIEAVLKAKKELLDERQKWQENLKRDAFLDENIPIIQMHFINELMNGSFTELRQIQKKAQLLEIPMSGPVYTVMLADARGALFDDGYRSGQELDMNFWQFMQKINQVIRNDKDVFWCETGDAPLLFLVNAESREDSAKKCRTLAAELLSTLTSCGREQVYIGIGAPAESPLGLCKSFSSAENAVLLSAWEPDRHIFYDTEKQAAEELPEYLSGKEREVITDLASERYEKAMAGFESLFESYRELRMDFRKVKKFCDQLCLFAMHLPSRESAEETAEVPVVDEFRDAMELKSWMIQFLQRRFSGQAHIAAQYSELTQKSIRYMQMHYAEDITLKSLSKIVFASPNYLGRVFFSDVGCRLGDWLNRYRVGRAKELLVSTDKKTYEIAEEVGFSGYKYFSVCFLKYTGCSARDYRNKYKNPLSKESEAGS